MTEPVFHFTTQSFGALAKMPKQTRKLWLDLTLQAKPDKKLQIVKLDAPLRFIKPLLDAGFLKPRIYGGQAIKGSFTISPDVFYCTTEPTIGEIWLGCGDESTSPITQKDAELA